MSELSQCLNSLQDSHLPLSTNWLVRDLCPGVPFPKIRYGTQRRTIAGSLHRVYSSTTWEMNCTGPTASCSSPGYNHWCHWNTETNYFPNYLLSPFLSVHPGSPTDGLDHLHHLGPNRFTGYCGTTKSMTIIFINSRKREALHLPQRGMLLFCQPVGYSKRFNNSRWISKKREEHLDAPGQWILNSPVWN